ncbi:MAG: DUF4928 domain-containing protein [Chloroflexi bacterium]|nr:DUF4928 domain-containing protein [Chloroflexota bacterium]
MSNYNVDSMIRIIEDWLDKDRNGRGASINTLSGVAIVLDRLCEKAPINDEDVITTGGQLRGGRGSNLRAVLRKYGLRDDLLSDGVTTRSTQRFRDFMAAIDYGKELAQLSQSEREEVVRLAMKSVSSRVLKLTTRDPLVIDLSNRKSLTAQVTFMLNLSRERSRGRVEQHLVGAKLEERFGREKVNRERAYSADVQTSRAGDFAIGTTIYHVTASPMLTLGQKIRANLAANYTPVLIVPGDMITRATDLMNELELNNQVEIFSLEMFLTQNILEMADSQGVNHTEMLRRILAIYNERIQATETDQSLRINFDVDDDLGERMTSNPRN